MMEKEDMEWKEGKCHSPIEYKPTIPDNGIRHTKKSGSCLTESGIPVGLEALFRACRQIYPEQPNPLQVTTLVKYWLGGPDPLDYVSMYEVPGDPKLCIPPHWHYISFGLSDIHGDGRVHAPPAGLGGGAGGGPGGIARGPSGFGFELTMRLRRDTSETTPPTWPAAIMQGLAKYVFQTGSVLCVGDHVSWHAPLDGSESRLQHMLMAEDPRLGRVETPNGSVQFVQVVGITSDELKAVQHWNGAGVLDIMKRSLITGGPWLVSDARRGESIYDVDPGVAEEVEAGIEGQGSNLSGVSARISWSTNVDDAGFKNTPMITTACNKNIKIEPPETPPALRQQGSGVTGVMSEQIKTTLKKGLLGDGQTNGTTAAQHSSNDRKSGGEEPTNCTGPDADGRSDPAELLTVTRLEALHLTINLESGALLPLALRGRLQHGRHFTFQSTTSVSGLAAATLVAPGVSGAFVSAEAPYATKGPWLQALLPPALVAQMSKDLAALADPDEVVVPVTFRWPDSKLAITIVGENAA